MPRMTFGARLHSWFVQGCAIAVLLFLLSLHARAQIVADRHESYRHATTATRSFTIAIPSGDREYGISVTAVLETGSGTLRVIGPHGRDVFQHLWSTHYSKELSRLRTSGPATYTVQVKVDNARGEWRARIVALPARSALRWMYLSASLLIVLPLAAVAWVRMYGTATRFIFAGMAMFAIALAFFFTGAVALDIAEKYALEDALPYNAFLWTQGIVLGAWQGFVAAMAVLAVAWAMPSLREKPARAIAAGIGTGALEMLGTGLVSLRGLQIMFGGGPKSDKAQFLQAYDMAVTPLLPLADPAILALRTICAIAATTLIIYGLRVRRARPVFGGFLIFGSELAVVGVSRAVSLFGPESRWLILAAIVPLAAISCIVLRRNLAAWTGSLNPDESVLDAFERRHG